MKTYTLPRVIDDMSFQRVLEQAKCLLEDVPEFPDVIEPWNENRNACVRDLTEILKAVSFADVKISSNEA